MREFRRPAENAIQIATEPQFLYYVSVISGCRPVLCSVNRLSGQRVQPRGLRPLPAFFHIELSHSLVNDTQWLTGRARSRRGSCSQGE